MRLIGLSCGTYYHVEALEGQRYASIFDAVVPPEGPAELAPRPDDVVLVACRSSAPRLIPQAPALAAHLSRGGTVVAMGESRSDLWLPGVAFTPVPTNWWWWLETGAELGVRIAAPDHPLLEGQDARMLTWHLHGWFDPAAGAQVLATDSEGRAILYLDAVTTPGRMVVTSLDPLYHHGSHFMPATTRFLDCFLPALRRWARSEAA